MGHLHLNVRDVEVSKKFWVQQMGGDLVRIGKGEAVKFAGSLVMLRKRDEVQAGSGAVAYVEFRSRDLETVVQRAKVAGTPMPRYEKGKRASFLTPEQLRVHVYQDRRQAQAMIFARIHFRVSRSEALREWYRRLLDVHAKAAGAAQVLQIPGADLTFSEAGAKDPAPAGTAIDHIGFEVRELEARAKVLEKKGFKFDLPFRYFDRVNVGGVKLIDPAGVPVMLTEGLSRY